MDIAQRIAELENTKQHVAAEALRFLEDTPAEMNVEQRTQWLRYNTRVDELDENINMLRSNYRQQQQDDTLREAEHQVFGETTTVNREVAAANQFRSWLRGTPNMIQDTDGALTDAYRISIRGAALERQMLREGASPIEIRDLAWDATSGSLTVPTSLARALYQKLEASIALFRMPVFRITTSSGNPMNFDRIETHSIATQSAGQGSSVAGGTDTVFGQLSLTPAKYVETIKLASELVTDNEVGVEGIVGSEIGRAIGRVVDSVEIPRMIPATGLGSVNTGGSLIGPTYNNLIDLEYAVNDAYRSDPGMVGWLFNDKTLPTIRKIRDGAGGTEGYPMWQPGFNGGLAAGQPARLDEYPLFTDPNVASMASNARIGAFGNWGGYYFRSVGDVIIDRSTERYYDTDQIAFRGRWRAIGGYQDTTAVVLMKQNV